jgi:hypothetical protein
MTRMPYNKLTPYDTGEILEPKLWLKEESQFKGITASAEFGRVDFENDESNTEFTVWFERTDDGYRMHVITHSGTAPQISLEGVDE